MKWHCALATSKLDVGKRVGRFLFVARGHILPVALEVSPVCSSWIWCVLLLVVQRAVRRGLAADVKRARDAQDTGALQLKDVGALAAVRIAPLKTARTVSGPAQERDPAGGERSHRAEGARRAELASGEKEKERAGLDG